eukprot:544921-Hanusia_phi.AAC.2
MASAAGPGLSLEAALATCSSSWCTDEVRKSRGSPRKFLMRERRPPLPDIHEPTAALELGCFELAPELDCDRSDSGKSGGAKPKHASFFSTLDRAGTSLSGGRAGKRNSPVLVSKGEYLLMAGEQQVVPAAHPSILRLPPRLQPLSCSH